jgi:hypothetical protein
VVRSTAIALARQAVAQRKLAGRSGTPPRPLFRLTVPPGWTPFLLRPSPLRMRLSLVPPLSRITVSWRRTSLRSCWGVRPRSLLWVRLKELLNRTPKPEEPELVSDGPRGVSLVEVLRLAREAGVDVEHSQAVSPAEAVAQDLARERQERVPAPHSSVDVADGNAKPVSEIDVVGRDPIPERAQQKRTRKS